MNNKHEFSFGNSSVAHAYDSMLVPVLFEPWADRLIKEFQPWEGRRVLDLATGTGVVAERLPKQVGPKGQVFAADMNSEMLALAKKRCAGLTPEVKFIETPAHPLEAPDDSFDFVVCQQGFQFFPDKLAAAKEIFRVLSTGGQTTLTIWCPIEECQFFKAACEALEEINEPEISEMLQVPFSPPLASELTRFFESAGFVNVKIQKQELELVVEQGVARAIQIIYSSPIGPKLKELSDTKQKKFQEIVTERTKDLSPDGTSMGRMVTYLLSAEKR